MLNVFLISWSQASQFDFIKISIFLLFHLDIANLLRLRHRLRLRLRCGCGAAAAAAAAAATASAAAACSLGQPTLISVTTLYKEATLVGL